MDLDSGRVELTGTSFELHFRGGTSDGDGSRESKPPRLYPEFISVSRRFMTVMQSIWKYVHGVGSLAGQTSANNTLGLMIFFFRLLKSRESADASSTPLAELVWNAQLHPEGSEPKPVTIKAPIYGGDDLSFASEAMRNYNAATRILNETGVQQIVNCVETLMADALRIHFEERPGIIDEKRTIPYSTVLSFASLDDAKRFVIEDEVIEFTRWSIHKQFGYIQSKLNVDVPSQFPDLPELYEVVLRRHAIVHAGGVATAEYLQRAKEIAKDFRAKIAPGKLLPLDGDYVRRAWNLAYAAGAVLIYLLRIQCARTHKSKEGEADAALELNEFAFQAIRNEQYEAARLVLNFASNRTIVEEAARWMILINLAQTHKWTGDPTTAETLLSKVKWTECGAKYRLAVGALRGDISGFRQLLPAAIGEGITLENVLGWPVFKEIREHEAFEDIIRAAFGSQVNNLRGLLASRILDPNASSTGEALLDVLRNELAPQTSDLSQRTDPSILHPSGARVKLSPSPSRGRSGVPAKRKLTTRSKPKRER